MVPAKCTGVSFVFLSLLAVVLPDHRAWCQARESSQQPLQSVEQLIQTPREQTSEKGPIRVQGTISAVGGIVPEQLDELSYHPFCLEDATGGIWVRTRHAIAEGILKNEATTLPRILPGAFVEIEGMLEPGGFAPVMRWCRIWGPPGSLRRSHRVLQPAPPSLFARLPDA
ncbi:MAG: hypothetical protein AAF670_20750, partial [Planctomycetota bacterium]